MDERIFSLSARAVFSLDRATVTEVAMTTDASIAVWGLKSRQTVTPHYHPDGQDTWIVLKGDLTYLLGNGDRRTLTAGQLAIATPGQIHGAINESEEDAIFVSIYSAPQIGYVAAIE